MTCLRRAMTTAEKGVTSLVPAEVVISIEATPTWVKQDAWNPGGVNTAGHEDNSLCLLFWIETSAQQGTLKINAGG
jgi:hypothetical protein